MEENINKKLKGMLSKDRYKHSLGVQRTAEELARLNGADVYKASTAGLIHDCAREFSSDALIRTAEEAGIKIEDIFIKQPELLHGPVGAYIVQKEFKIKDAEIINSIKYHTTGCANMSLLDKIIYVADYIEPGRNFKGVDVLRKETYNDINKGILMALDNTLKYIIERGLLIHKLTVEARNFMLDEIHRYT